MNSVVCFGQQFLLWFYVHHYLSHAWNGSQDMSFYFMSNLMSFPNSERTIDDDVKVDIIAKAHLADMTFL